MSEFKAKELLVRSPSAGSGADGRPTHWAPTPFARVSMSQCLEFFGRKNMAARQVETKALEDRAQGSGRKRLQFPGHKGEKSVKARKRQHHDSVQAAIAAFKEGSREGVLGPLPGPHGELGQHLPSP